MSGYFIRSQGGVETGPIDADGLRGLARDGFLGPDAEVRRSDRSQWMRVTEFPELILLIPGLEVNRLENYSSTQGHNAIETPVRQSLESGSVLTSSDVRAGDMPSMSAQHLVDSSSSESLGSRPWVRLWARMFDLNLFFIPATILMFAVVAWVNPPPRSLQSFAWVIPIVWFILCGFGWSLVEPIFISRWGTSPGKWLLRTRVHFNRSGKISYSDAVGRCFAVWSQGTACNIDILMIYTGGLSYFKLARGETLGWDIESDTTVQHRRIGNWRYLFVVCFAVVFTVSYSLRTLLSIVLTK